MINSLLLMPVHVSVRGFAVSAAPDGEALRTFSSPFQLSLADWKLERQTTEAIRKLAPEAPSYLKPYWIARLNRQELSDIQPLYDAFRRLDFQAKIFQSRAFPGLVATAEGIITYAQQTVPRNYGRMRDILAAAETVAPSKKEQMEFMRLIRECNASAVRLIRPAHHLLKYLRQYSEQLRDFTTAFNQTAHNPAQLITDAGQIPVGADQTNNIAGTTAPLTENNGWLLTWDASKRACRIVLAARPNLCIAPNRRKIAEFRFPSFLCGIEPVNAADSSQLWLLDPASSHQVISWFNRREIVLDLSGSSGWGPGTQLLAYPRHGGANQRWSFTPRLLQFWDEAFYLAVRPFARNTNLTTVIEHILGAWRAILDDLDNVKKHIQTQFDLNEPFLSGLRMDAVIRAWEEIGAESRDLIQNAARN